jgi:ABC-type transporter Mla MlaB component
MSNTLTLLGDATLYDVEALYGQIQSFLAANLAQADQLILDLGQLQSVDASFLQLLLSLRLDNTIPKNKLKIINVSNDIKEKAKAICMVEIASL